MVVSARQLATRALVQVLLALAAAYGVDLRVNRDSSEDAIKDAHRSVVRRVVVRWGVGGVRVWCRITPPFVALRPMHTRFPNT